MGINGNSAHGAAPGQTVTGAEKFTWPSPGVAWLFPVMVFDLRRW